MSGAGGRGHWGYRGPQDKKLLIEGQLRGKFARLQRVDQDREALLLEIKTLVKALAEEERVPFLRIDAVRQRIMGVLPEEEAAG